MLDVRAHPRTARDSDVRRQRGVCGKRVAARDVPVLTRALGARVPLPRVAGMSNEALIVARMFVAKLQNEGAQFERSTLMIASELADILDGFKAADMTAEYPEHDRPFAVGDRVRMRSAEMHALRGVGTIFAIDGDSATVSWDTVEHAGVRLTGATTSVYHADIRRAVER